MTGLHRLSQYQNLMAHSAYTVIARCLSTLYFRLTNFKPEDLFATLAGGKKFTKLDLSHTCQQVLLKPESRKYVTVNTHKGLYQYSKLPSEDLTVLFVSAAGHQEVYRTSIQLMLNNVATVAAPSPSILVSRGNLEKPSALACSSIALNSMS